MTTTASPSSSRSAEEFALFCSRYCGLELERFQLDIVEEVMEGRRELLVMLPRGCGKTTLFAALALHHLVTTEQPAVYVAAASRDQARLTFEIARRMAAGHPSLDRRVAPRYSELRVRDGFMRVLSSDAPRAHGLQPTLALVDELHAHRTADLYVALKTALGKRAEAQLATISTAGYDKDSVLGQLRERALSLPGVERDGARTVARDAASSFAFLEWACDPEDDLTDAEVVKRANPATFVSVDFLREQLASPGLHPLEFARFHANVWTETADAWLPTGAWEACAGDASIEPGEEVYLGVDIGGERAASALVTVTPDLRVACEVYQGSQSVLTVQERIEALAGAYTVRQVVYDPWRFGASAIELERRGLVMEEFPQTNARLCPASERLYAAIVERRLKHPDDPVLNRHVRTAIARETPRGWRLDKAQSRQQIDACVALAAAVEAAERRPPPPELLGWI